MSLKPKKEKKKRSKQTHLQELITDERMASKEYSAMAKAAKKQPEKKMFKAMSEDEAKHEVNLRGMSEAKKQSATLPPDIVKGTLDYIHGKRLTKSYWRSLDKSYGWTEKTIVEEVAKGKVNQKKLKAELETMQAFPVSEVDYISRGKIGRCLPNAIRAYRNDHDNEIYHGYLVSEVGWATRETGEPRYTVYDHFFNVNNGRVQEWTKLGDKREDVFYVGNPISIEQARKEKTSGDWNP